MSIVSFELSEIILFIFLVIYLTETLILTALFLKKYFEVKKIEFLYVGLFLLGFSIASTFHWILAFILLALVGITLDPTFLYFFQGISAITLIFWILASDKLILANHPRKKVYLILMVVITIVTSAIYYIVLFIDWQLIGTLDPKGWTPLTWSILASTILAIEYLVFFVTYLIFIYKALKTPNERIKLKGKILLLAGILIGISILVTFILGFFEGIIYWVVTFSIVHVVRIIAFFFFYVGFTLPKFIERTFLKEE
ncbi:MAG: membrane protein of unknown function [Promethearchaeota archaeon]|nr:MAG: membrane protein of unknown function [Candidatus Lokiarchaeota archaeon]